MTLGSHPRCVMAMPIRRRFVAILGVLLLGPCAARAAEQVEELRAALYATNAEARRLDAAGKLLAVSPADALDEFGKILRTPAAPFNQSFQTQLCRLLAKRGDAASMDLILRKQKENSERAMWVVEDALLAASSRASVSKLIPGLLTSLRAADRELGFFLIGKMGLTEHKDVFVKALVQERNRPAFEQAIESATSLSRSARIATNLVTSLSLVPAFDDRRMIVRVAGKSGDTSCVPALTELLHKADADGHCLGLEGLSLLNRPEALRDAMTTLKPASDEPPDIPGRDKLKGFALEALLRYPAESIVGEIPILLAPAAAFLFDHDERAVDSRLFLLDWMTEHPDVRFAPALTSLLESEEAVRLRQSAVRALGATKAAAATGAIQKEANKGDPEAVVALGLAGGTASEQYLLSRLGELMQSGPDQAPDTTLGCIAALGRFSSPAAIEALGKVAQLNLLPFSAEALKQLGTMKDTTAQGFVVDALKSPNADIRRAACIVIGRSGGTSQLKTLDLLSRRDQSQAVRDAAREAATSIRARLPK